MPKRGAFLLLALVAFLPVSTAAAAPAWEQWRQVHGVFDVGGPRADGSLIVAGSAALSTLTPDGAVAPFARGPGGYRDDPGLEAYLAVSPGQHVASSGCDFARDDVFIERLHTPIGITRVFASGEESGSFANVDMSSLNGLVFDTVGSFDHRLLVAGPRNGRTGIVAIDCNGVGKLIAPSAPPLEGGLAVAPSTFGAFAGDLVAPDELSGIIWAISPDGTATQVVNSGLPKGQDIGVESVAFVPSGFTRGGFAYYADRATAGSAHPGSDSVLRLAGTDLVAAGVQDGDMLAATEGGASLIDVRCATSCRVTTVIGTPTAAHGEGHLVFTLNRAASPSPRSSATVTATQPRAGSSGVPIFVAIAAAVLAALAGVLITLAAIRRSR